MTLKYCLDSSALIDAWDELYIPEVFPGLYEVLKDSLPSKCCLIDKIYEEIRPSPSWSKKKSRKEASENN